MGTVRELTGIESSSVKTVLITLLATVATGLGATASADPAVGAPKVTPGLVVPADATWALRTKLDERLLFRGQASFDEAGLGTGAMLYPAPGLVGFVAALVTHGLLNEGAKSAQREQIQRQADEVLTPYRTVLDALTHRRLADSAAAQVNIGAISRVALQLISDDAAPPAGAWVIASSSIFTMTQDQMAIVLDQAISIFAPATPEDPVYRNTVRIVAKPLTIGNPVDHWVADDGRGLREVSAALWAESIRVAVADMSAPAPPVEVTHRTVRYREGGVERMERAQILDDRCGRLLIRNLRGWLKSVPKQGDDLVAQNGDCAAAP